MEYKMVLPQASFEEKYFDCVREFEEQGNEGADWTPFSARPGKLNYSEWLVHIHLQSFAPEKGFVPSTLFFFMDEEDNLLGFFDIRHTLNDSLRQVGGNIGYGLRPSARGKGLAPIMLRLGLLQASALGIENALITCYADNEPSARTIISCGGKFKRALLAENGRIVQHYYVDTP